MSIKTQKNSRGRPSHHYRLRSRQEVHDLIKQYGRFRLLEMAVLGPEETLPTYFQPEILAALDVHTPHEDELLTKLDDLTEQLKRRSPQFKEQINRSWGRYKGWYDQLCHDLNSSDFEDLKIDDDLRGQGRGRMVLAAQMLRFDHELYPGKKHPWWLDCVLTGLSNGSVTKLRKLAKLRHTAPPFETCKIVSGNPEAAIREVEELARRVGGYPRLIVTPDGREIPYNAENVWSVMAQTARGCRDVYQGIAIKFNVARPLERYEPESVEKTPSDRATARTKRAAPAPGVSPITPPRRTPRYAGLGFRSWDCASELQYVSGCVGLGTRG